MCGLDCESPPTSQHGPPQKQSSSAASFSTTNTYLPLVRKTKPRRGRRCKKSQIMTQKTVHKPQPNNNNNNSKCKRAGVPVEIQQQQQQLQNTYHG